MAEQICWSGLARVISVVAELVDAAQQARSAACVSGGGSGLKITDEVNNKVTYRDLKELVGVICFIRF